MLHRGGAAFISHRDLAWLDLISWLTKHELTIEGRIFDARPSEVTNPASSAIVLGAPVHRATPLPNADLKKIKDRFKSDALSTPTRQAAIWSEIKKPDDAVRQLATARMPAEAIAFYRPFHVQPVDQWGIYVSLKKLLNYAANLTLAYRGLRAFDERSLISWALFDVFHHEFFHHLVECTATSIEIIRSDAEGRPIPVYLPYWSGEWSQYTEPSNHEPLEEALANAYAHNSFALIARVKGGYLAGLSRIYQKALIKGWKNEPPGYNAAEMYVNDGRYQGSREVVDRMLAVSGQHEAVPSRMLVEALFPRGHTAYWSKPEIPTYFVGTEQELAAFTGLVPAPNETYTSLFYPDDTSSIDLFMQTQRKKEREARIPKPSQ